MHEIATAFLVSKSENRNQVHYAVAVDAACAPSGAAPVRPYWRMLERGPDATEPLLEREQPAYGVAWQQSSAGVVRLALRGLPSRTLEVRAWRGADGACTSSVTTWISGARARLFNVHLALGFLRVDHILLTGWRDDGVVVRERLTP